MAQNYREVKLAEIESVTIDGKEYAVINGSLYAMRKSKYAVNYSPVIVSDNMSGKMEGIPSISTSVLCNPICHSRRNVAGSICEKCFAASTASRYSDLSKNLESNFHLLTAQVLPREILPVFGNVRIARIESFGDVSTVEQAINYCNICKVNPRVVFGWWTKNVEIVEKAFDLVGKPDNVVFIQSSMFVNRKEDKRSEYVDKVFTVYDDAFISEIQEVNACLEKLAGMDKRSAKAEKTRIFEALFVNCGARNCVACGKCYDTNNKTAEIRERLK